MSRFIICDIETIPHPDAGSWFDPVKPAANLKDPVKVAASIAEKDAARADGFGLDPDCCQIAALGYHVVGGADPFCETTRGSEKVEAAAIEHLWWTFQKNPDTRFVTFYGRQFDLPVLLRRSMYLGVKHPRVSLDRWKSPHIDVWDVLTFGGALRTAHSLKFYCKRMGIQTNDPFNGAQVSEMAAAGRWDDIRDHCLSDVGACHAIANRLGLLEIQ